MPTEVKRALFLSYASQDAVAARRICDTLRAGGIEVWFDQSELKGGEAWDASIRRQVAECALFLPVLSENTQARREGYFRLEWKLADERTHLMAEGTPFILPVTIDGTTERGALVPKSFFAVQWTKAPGGETPPALVDRVKELLNGGVARVSRPVGSENTGQETRASAKPRPRVPTTAWLTAVTFVVVAFSAAIFFWRKSSSASAEARPPATEKFVPAANVKTVAVLPFENLTTAAESADFTDGMHMEVLTALGKVADLKVIGRTSVLPYADRKRRNHREIASTLGVGSVVEGSVRRIGNQVRIAVELIDTQSSRQLWTESYTRDLTDVFAIQSAIAQEVAARLNATLTASERSLLDRRPTRNPRAYELFLRAQQLNNDLVSATPVADWERGVRLLEEAVAADPEFVPALSLLVYTHCSMYWHPSIDPSPARRERALAALAALQRVAPTAPETEFALGALQFMCELNFAQALRHFEAAQPGLPNNSVLLRLAGFAKFQLGRYDDGIATVIRSYELNPLELQNPIDLIIYYSMLRRFPAAVAVGDRVNAKAQAGYGPPLGASGRGLELARFAIDGDRVGLVRRTRALPPRPYDPAGLFGDYECAMLDGDLAAAARTLADVRLDGVYFAAGPAAGPVALHRAYVAHLLGQREVAAEEARKATTQLRAMTPIPRLRLYVDVQLARAAACGGSLSEARQLADAVRRDLPTIFLMDRLNVLNELGRTYALIGAREEALDCLRTLMTGPTIALNLAVYYSPNAMRIDPCWSRLKDDPRFEEILKAAKPL